MRNILSFAVSLKATELLQDLRILGGLGEIDHVAQQALHQIVVEAVALQDLEGVVPCADGFELEAVLVPVVVVQKRIEDLSFVEELFEDPELAELEDGDAHASLDGIEGIGLHEEISCGIHGGFAIKVMAFN